MNWEDWNRKEKNELGNWNRKEKNELGRLESQRKE